jgi:hypothetical protein
VPPIVIDRISNQNIKVSSDARMLPAVSTPRKGVAMMMHKRADRTAATTRGFLIALTIVMCFSMQSVFAAHAIYTTTKDATVVNANIYGATTDVYLSGGPQNTNNPGLPDGTYYFQITDPSGKVLLSTDNASCRQLVVSGGRVTGASPAAGACAHQNGTFNPDNGATPVQMAPFSPTPNAGLEYKAWLIAQTSSTSISGTDPKVILFDKRDASTDNFKARAATVPTGSCQPSSSLSVLVNGSSVVAYVPKGNWSVTPVTDVSAVNIEGSAITPTRISTPNIVNSCASNPLTGQTVCTANNTDVYVLSGTTITNTLTSAGVGAVNFSGGSCTNCGVTMDATHNKAVIVLNTSAGPGFQFVDLGATPTFEPAFASKNPGGASFPPNVSEDPLIDPIRNLLLSAAENNDYEIVNVATSTSPTFFENVITSGVDPFFDSSGEDCSTGIALADPEASSPTTLYLADLTQATFTLGSPGTWTAPSQVQTLTESDLSSLGGVPGGLAVAQGTHTGFVAPEFGGSGLTTFALPATSGTGTPAIGDWVTCQIPGFSIGFDPHTVTAYQSPASNDAIGILANSGASTVAVVDLTQMLNPTIVPRTAGGHGCAAGTLPASVVHFVSVP